MLKLNDPIRLFIYRIMASLRSKLLNTVMDPVPTSTHKVTVVGVGNVGMACTISLLAKVSFFVFLPMIHIYILVIEKSYSSFNIFRIS